MTNRSALVAALEAVLRHFSRVATSAQAAGQAATAAGLLYEASQAASPSGIAAAWTALLEE